MSILKSEHTCVYHNTLYFWGFCCFMVFVYRFLMISQTWRGWIISLAYYFFFLIPTILALFSKCRWRAHLLKEMLFRHVEHPWWLSACPGHSPWCTEHIASLSHFQLERSQPMSVSAESPIPRTHKDAGPAAQASQTLPCMVHHTMTNEMSLLVNSSLVSPHPTFLPNRQPL